MKKRQGLAHLNKQSCRIQTSTTEGQPYSDAFPYKVSECRWLNVDA